MKNVMFKDEVLQGYYFEKEVLKRQGFAVTKECITDLREEGTHTIKVAKDKKTAVIKSKATKESLEVPYIAE